MTEQEQRIYELLKTLKSTVDEAWTITEQIYLLDPDFSALQPIQKPLAVLDDAIDSTIRLHFPYAVKSDDENP